jgi:hypothetical protein
MFKVTRRVVVGFALLGCAAVGASVSAGCGGDDTGSGGTTASSGTTTAATTGTTTGTTSASSGSGGSGGSGGAGGAGVCECGDTCMATPPAGCLFDPNDPIDVCAADVCEAEATACCDIPGCLELVACVRETECVSFDCYMPETCKAETDTLGGVTSDGVVAAQALGDCAVPACSGCM